MAKKFDQVLYPLILDANEHVVQLRREAHSDPIPINDPSHNNNPYTVTIHDATYGYVFTGYLDSVSMSSPDVYNARLIKTSFFTRSSLLRLARLAMNVGPSPELALLLADPDTWKSVYSLPVKQDKRTDNVTISVGDDIQDRFQFEQAIAYITPEGQCCACSPRC